MIKTKSKKSATKKSTKPKAKKAGRPKMSEKAKKEAAIERFNKKMALAFKLATKPEKRVMIALDVITQVKSHKFIPERGSYMILNKSVDTGDDLQKVIQDKKSTCTVCALGGLFACKVNISNNTFVHEDSWEDTATMPSYSSRVREAIIEKPTHQLKDIFSSKQLEMIESAFECSNAFWSSTAWKKYHSYLVPPKKILAAIKFGKGYNNDTDRMVAIMKNIVENKGTFKP